MTEPETDVQRLRRLLSAASLEAGIAEEGETLGCAPCRCGGFRTPGDRKCGIAIGGRAKCPGGTVWEWLRDELAARKRAESKAAALEAALRPFATAYRNFRAAPVGEKRHPRVDPIVWSFDVWREADAALLSPEDFNVG